MSDKDLFGEPITDKIWRTARFSADRKYRYTLERYWHDNLPLVFILLNPSTADENHDDPTNRRGMDFARKWGHGGCVFVNLFAYRTPYPKVLLHKWEDGVDIVGPRNLEIVIETANDAGLVVCAWGNHGVFCDQDARVLQELRDMGIPLSHMGLTKSGCPKHILYLRGDTEPQPFNETKEAK